jgi:glyoxylase-like metal-dependent hydrolase (beta-lactamase superfamily II)/rhodanese-related sulfurtransferase
MEIRELNGSNCKSYALIAQGQVALVDPVRERVESYRRDIERNGWQLDLLIETHTHADHLMLNRDLRDSLGAPLLMHRESPNPLVSEHLSDGEKLELGGETIQVIHSPGHTPDSICLLVPGAVLTGDTLLIAGSGRTDFPGGDAGAQYEAITQRLFSLADETTVWPGHDYKGRSHSSIGLERRTNPRLAGTSREEYVEIMANLGIGVPDRIQEVLQVNQSGFENLEVAFPMVSDVAAVPQVEAAAVAKRLALAEPPLLLDVREPEEFVGELGHVEGAILVPLDALETRLPKLAGYVDREIVVVCRAGARSATAVAMLERAGFTRVANLTGGMLAWARASLPVQR